jgi:hypothetical protein
LSWPAGSGHQRRQQSTSSRLVLDCQGWVFVGIQCCRCPQSWRVAWAIKFLQPCHTERAKEYIQGSGCHHFDLAWFCQHGIAVTSEAESGIAGPSSPQPYGIAVTSEAESGVAGQSSPQQYGIVVTAEAEFGVARPSSPQPYGIACPSHSHRTHSHTASCYLATTGHHGIGEPVASQPRGTALQETCRCTQSFTHLPQAQPLPLDTGHTCWGLGLCRVLLVGCVCKALDCGNRPVIGHWLQNVDTGAGSGVWSIPPQGLTQAPYESKPGVLLGSLVVGLLQA